MRIAVPAAPEPAPPVKLMIGAEVYPEPLFVIVTLVTDVPVRTAVPAAPVPPPPVKTTVGAEVYPVPPAATTTEATVVAVKAVVPAAPAPAFVCPQPAAFFVYMASRTPKSNPAPPPATIAQIECPGIPRESTFGPSFSRTTAPVTPGTARIVPRRPLTYPVLPFATEFARLIRS